MKKLLMFLLVTLFPCLLISPSLIAQEKKTEPVKPALVVIDVQKAFVPMVEAREKEIAYYIINVYIR